MSAGSRLWAAFKTSSARFGIDFSRYAWATLTWIPVVIFVNDHVFMITKIRGPSMSPFFNERFNETTDSDRCLEWKFRAHENLARGQVVTFRWVDPPEKEDFSLTCGHRKPMAPDGFATKRIVALPDDIVHTRPPFPNPVVRVPPGHVWVEGDAGSSLSKDSNTYGPISIQLIQGHITHIVWPLRKAGRVRWWEHPERPAVYRQ